MISRLFAFICLWVCVLCSFVAFAQPREDKDLRVLSNENYILILSSYQYNNPWATTVAKRIQQQLEKENPEFVFRIVYASLDIPQTMLASRLNMQKAFAQARLTPKIIVPRILVLVGDESWMLYRIMDLRGKWEKVPVVLCGVHEKIQKDYADFFGKHSFADSLMVPVARSAKALSVTGVLQESHGDRMATLIRKTFPALKEMIYISNGGYNDEYHWHQQRQSLSALLPQVKLSYFNSLASHKDSICQYVNSLSPDSAALLFHSQPSFAGQLQLPAYSLSDWASVNNKVVGGCYASSDQLAVQTARLIMRIYKGEPTSRLPLRFVENRRVWLNAQASCLPESKWHQSDLPDFAYYNVPPPFFIRHLRSIGWFLLATSILVIGIVIYLKTRRYQSHLQRLLAIYRELHEKYQAIYDNVPIALLIFNERGDLQYENPAGKKLLRSWYGETHDRLNLFDEQFIHPSIQEKIRDRKNVSQIFSMQDGCYQARPSVAFLDSCEYFRLVIRYIPDETGDTDNILMLLVDNTEIYQAKVAHKRIHSVLDFAMGKASINVVEYNLFGKTGMLADNAANGPAHDPASAPLSHIADEDREKLEQFYQQAARGESNYFNEDIKVVREDGAIHYLRKQIKVMEYQPENRQIWVAELEQDIDKEKEYVDELQAAIHKAAEGERLKNTFIANMSHEIRSPLNAIVGFSNLMGTMEEIEARRGIIHYIEENNEILLRQVNDIVELSRMESGSMAFAMSETNINELLQDAVIAHQFRAAPKNIRIETHFPLEECYVITDKIRIRQVIANFLSNAIQYTGQDGSIHTGYRLEKKMLYVYVTDTGIGIPGKQLPKIFGRFFRAHNEYQGFGLGLSIARAVIEGLKGKIGVESEEGRGSTFWFQIPVELIYKSLQTSLGTDKETAVMSGPLPHILTVDDDESSFLLIQFMLKNLCRVTRAKNENEAVRLFREGQPDLVLVNIKVPGNGSCRVVLDTRALSPQVPVIAITGFAFSKDENKALENSFNDYLPKPLDRGLLLKTINKWLNKAN